MIDIEKWIKDCLKAAGPLPSDSIDIKVLETGTRVRIDVGDWRLYVGAVKKPTIPTYGLSNLTYDGKHVLFLDYDNIQEELVKEELRCLVDEYKLSNFYLFYTRRERLCGEWVGSYHAISLTRLLYKDILEILRRCHVDEAFRDAPLYTNYKFWVLRLVSKGDRPPPKFLCLVPEEPVNMDREVSRGHKLLLERLFKLPELPYKNLDNSKEVKITVYKTGKI